MNGSMGKNVYAAPRKGPAGKWVEPSGKKPRGRKDDQQSRQARLQALAAQYKKNLDKHVDQNVNHDKGNA